MKGETAMAAGKWIGDLGPATSVLDAARHCLTVRMETVRSQLEEAQTRGQKDIETVHQLRVATRRARAALDIFTACLPKKASKKANRYLRKLRRAAGEVRDWDVFLLSLSERGEEKNRQVRPALDLVRGLALMQRESARVTLAEASQSQPFAFERLEHATLAAVRASRRAADDTLMELALPVLQQRIESLKEAVESISEDLAHYHRIRIAGKHLRYTMEVFGACFRETFKDVLYPLVEQMQESLGKLHDSDLAIQRLRLWQTHCETTLAADWPRYRPGFEMLTQEFEQVIARERKKFKTCWRRWEKENPTENLSRLRLRRQRGGLVSTAGKDKTAPGDRLRSPGEPDVVRPGTVAGGS
jgi:CHAD domain-containing protein